MIPDLQGTGTEDVAYRLQLTIRAYTALKGDISQAAFARLIGFAPQVLNDYLKGRARLSVNAALAVKRVTGVSTDWLFAGDMTHLSAEMATEIHRLHNEDLDGEDSLSA